MSAMPAEHAPASPTRDQLAAWFAGVDLDELPRLEVRLTKGGREERPTSGLALALGRILTVLREGAGLSRRQQAARLGIEPVSLRALELGLANPTLGRVEELARAYRVVLTLHVEALDRENA